MLPPEQTLKLTSTARRVSPCRLSYTTCAIPFTCTETGRYSDATSSNISTFELSLRIGRGSTDKMRLCNSYVVKLKQRQDSPASDEQGLAAAREEVRLLAGKR